MGERVTAPPKKTSRIFTCGSRQKPIPNSEQQNKSQGSGRAGSYAMQEGGTNAIGERPHGGVNSGATGDNAI